MSVIQARDLQPGDRYIGKDGGVWVVLSTSPHSDIIRTIRSGTREVISAVPPKDREVHVLNRDDSLTTEQAVSNLEAAGLEPTPMEVTDGRGNA